MVSRPTPCRPRAIVSWLRRSPFQILRTGLPCTTSYREFWDLVWLTYLSLFHGLYPTFEKSGISPEFVLKDSNWYLTRSSSVGRQMCFSPLVHYSVLQSIRRMIKGRANWRRIGIKRKAIDAILEDCYDEGGMAILDYNFIDIIRWMFPVSLRMGQYCIIFCFFNSISCELVVFHGRIR
jgi:hypothetical protein